MPSTDTKVLIFLEGLSHLEEGKELLLDEETKNFYPSQDGYLRNYQGRVDLFDRSLGAPPASDTFGDPPALSSLSSVFSFIDSYYVEHLVYVDGMDLCEKIGNTNVVLYTFEGVDYDGVAYPTMFLHESKLIILNEDDPALIWDGIDCVTHLGVTEVPAAPINHSTTVPFINSAVMTAIAGATAGAITLYKWAYLWYAGNNYKPTGTEIQGYPYNLGPSSRTDGDGDQCDGYYRTVVQFVDKYGNMGKASVPSSLTGVRAFTVLAPDEQRGLYIGLLTEWLPPQSNDHIHYVVQGRTLNLNSYDEQPIGSDLIYYEEATMEGTTKHRQFQRLSDEALLNRDLIDMDVRGPPSGILGASFGRRVYLVDIDGITWFSDLVFMGQYRPTQQLKTYSQPRAVVPAGDRLFFVCDKSTEVWYESANGPALLEQDVEQGSSFGSTFVAVGDGVIFGLWNEGFGFYDGKTHKYVNVPYYIKKYYLGEVKGTIRSAQKINDVYYLTIRRNGISTDNNVILMFNLRTQRWHVINESVTSLAYVDQEIVGTDDSLYLLFRGDTFPESVIETIGIVANNINESRTITNVRLLMEPSSFQQMDLEVQGEERISKVSGDGYAHPLKSSNMVNVTPFAYWNTKFSYGEEWQTPGDVFMRFKHAKPVPGFYHKIKATFPSGHLVRVKAIELTYSKSHPAEGR